MGAWQVKYKLYIKAGKISKENKKNEIAICDLCNIMLFSYSLLNSPSSWWTIRWLTL